MGSVTAKHVKRAKDKTGAYPLLKALTQQTQEERSAITKAFDSYTVGIFDIEATALNASFGYALCAAIKPIGQKAKLFRIDRYPGYAKHPWDDHRLVVDIRDALERCDMIVTWNGSGYDLPFIDQRLVIHGERRIGPIHHVDLLPVARKKLRMHSNRLDAVAETLEVSISKTGLKPAIWQRASAGSKQAMKYILEHNLADVQVLEEVFMKMRSFVDAIFRKG